ncbi:MAG TPA: hypothetical protein VLH40_01875 [Atribacteraceae bacterium]|nr:hypothetical protein [Atribacteraceae bacterium]
MSKEITQNAEAECLINPAVKDPFTEVLREGARRLLTLAIEAEVEAFVKNHENLKDDQGHQAIVRNVCASGTRWFRGPGNARREASAVQWWLILWSREHRNTIRNTD